MAFALTVSANETKPEGTKKQAKKEKVQLNNQTGDPFSEPIWIVRMISEERMSCINGGSSHCPVYWFLNHEEK